MEEPVSLDNVHTNEGFLDQRPEHFLRFKKCVF